MRWLRGKASRGTSLVELMVASVIVLLLMFEIWKLVAAGARFYHRARSQSDVQRNSLIALRWMARDLSEGSAISFREYKIDGPSPVTHGGIVFGSPTVMGSTNVAYNNQGRMIWSSVIGYFIDPADMTLYRQQMPLPDPKKTFPPVIDNQTQSTDVLATLPQPRVVARQIKEIKTTQGPKDITIELITRDEELGFGIKVQTRLEMKN